MCAVAICIPAVAMMTAGSAAAATTVNLGTAAAASVLAGQGVTNTGPSILPLDLDTSPNPAITGFPPGIVLGTQHAADAVAGQAQSDLTIAYNAAAGQASTASVSADLGGQTLTEGVYTAASSMAITGPVPLTLRGDSSSVFIFQAGSTLITGSGSSVVLTGGVSACNVFWQVGSSATLGTTTSFVGNILALTSITLNTGATVQGRALARNGAVTLDSNTFTTPNCTATPPTTTPPTTTPPTTTPPRTTSPTTKPCPTTKPKPKPTPTTKPKPCPPKPTTTTKPCPPKKK